MRNTFKVLFYLKKSTNSTGKPISIMGRITVNNERIQFSTQLYVELSNWDVKANRVKGRSYEAQRINLRLNEIQGQITNTYNTLRIKDVAVTAEAVRNAYFGQDEDHKYLMKFYSDFLGKYKQRIGIDRDITTYRRYKKLQDHLSSFLGKEYKRSDIQLNMLKDSFIEDFLVFLQCVKGLKPMTVKGYIYCLKYVIFLAFNNGWIKTNPFAAFKYAPSAPEVTPISEEELQRLMGTKLPRKAWERTRDMFVFSCFTGISYADIRNLTYAQILQDQKGVWWIAGNRQKTSVSFSVRVLPVALAIIEKYRGLAGTERVFVLPEVKVMDKSLKYIAKICKIEKRLTFHMARHTFATTVALSNGVPLETLSKMLGHKHISTTQIYAKISNDRINDAMSKLENSIGNKYSMVEVINQTI